MITDTTQQGDERNEDITQGDTSVPVDDTVQNTDDNQQMSPEAMQIIALQKELAEMQQIAKKAQYDYINVKMEFDAFQSRMETKQRDAQVDTLVDIVKKIIPFVESLRKSVENIPDTLSNDPLAKGVVMVYKNIMMTFETMGITHIESLGLLPDTQLHEPVSVQPAQNKDEAGKIINEFEKGFMYQKNGIKKVIQASKVVVAQ